MVSILHIKGEIMRVFITIFLAAALLPAFSMAQNCIEYGDYSRWVKGVETPGYSKDVAISGTYAFVADYESGLQVIDIANPENSQIVGSIDTPGFAYGVAIQGNYAFVADCSSGLQVIDITNPENPQIIRSVDLEHCTNGITIFGNYAYLLGHFISIVDISDPENPQIVDNTYIGYANSFVISGNYAFVVGNDEDLDVFDIDTIPLIYR